jgi:hypothetical protein
VRVMQVLTVVRGEDRRMRLHRREIDARQLRVSVRAPYEGGVDGADLLDVVGIRGATGDEARIFAAPDPCADHRSERHYVGAPVSGGMMIPSPLGSGSSSGGVSGSSSMTACRGAPSRIAFAAARTAITMFS